MSSLAQSEPTKGWLSSISLFFCTRQAGITSLCQPGFGARRSHEASPAHWHSIVLRVCRVARGAVTSILLIPCDATHFSPISGHIPFWRRPVLSLFQTGQVLVAAAPGLFGLPQIICLLMTYGPLTEAAASFLTLSLTTCDCSADSSQYIIWGNCFHV